MVPIPDFLKDEVTVKIDDYTNRAGGISAQITLKTKRAFAAADQPGKVVPPDSGGVASTIITAMTREECDRKVSSVFTDLYYYYFRAPLSDSSPSFEAEQVRELRSGYWNETVSVATTAHCTEWREATGDPKAPFRSTILYEVDDHPVLGKAEAFDTHPAYTERGLGELVALARTWRVVKSNWVSPGAKHYTSGMRTIDKPHTTPFATYTREVFMSVRRRDLKPKVESE